MRPARLQAFLDPVEELLATAFVDVEQCHLFAGQAQRACGQRLRFADRDVPRLGYGAMRLPGPGVWGPPADRAEALAVLRRAVELGIRVIDTAWYYGLEIANRHIAEALSPYPDDLVLITKLGAWRGDDGSWSPRLDAAGLRAGNERDLRSLRLESIPVTHLRWTEQAAVPFDEALGTMIALRDEGKIQRIG